MYNCLVYVYVVWSFRNFFIVDLLIYYIDLFLNYDFFMKEDVFIRNF